MHVTIRRYHINPGSTSELIERIESGFLPIISKSRNFIAYYAVDEGDGDITAVSFYKDEASATASNELAASWAMKNLGSLISMPPKIIAGEVVAHAAA